MDENVEKLIQGGAERAREETRTQDVTVEGQVSELALGGERKAAAGHEEQREGRLADLR